MTAPDRRDLAAAWSDAVALLDGGKAAEAEARSRAALARHGEQPDLLLLLAVSLLRQGRPADALPYLDRLAQADGSRPDVLLNRGNALLDLGRPGDAEAPLREALRLSPQLWQPAYFLGIARERLGNHTGAAEAFSHVVALQPALWDAQLRLLTALRLGGRFAEAAAAARAALVHRPEDLGVRHDLAMLLALSGETAEALREVDAVLARAPDFPEALNTRGNVLCDLKRADEAVPAYRRALALAPGSADGHYNLANNDRDRETYAAAERGYLRALALAPEHRDARNNLATALLADGQVDRAIALYRVCLRQLPGWPEATFNLGMGLLLKGDMAEGLAAYESRWQVKSFPGVRRNFPQPLWDGAPFPGRRLLLHAEQGAGDTIQFARYVPLACARGGEVLLNAPGNMVRLLASLEGGAKIIPPGETLPQFDVQLPLGSAMHAFRTELASIPAKVPYLGAAPADRERWRRRLIGEGLKVGITWQGNPDQGSEPHRSIALSRLRPLLDVPGCRFFALQKEFGREQMTALPAGMLDDLGPELGDFADSAAAIAELDLVISTCTSVAHLAGALGKPTWVLLRYSPDWRWLLGRDDSPWYPTARLFRQDRPGAWDGVVDRLATALRQRVS